MKCLALCAARIRALLLSNKLISALYFVGVLLAVSSMLFMYMTQLSQVRYDEEGYYKYVIRSGGGEVFSLDKGLEATSTAASLPGEREDFLWGGFYAVCTLGQVFEETLNGYGADTSVHPMVLFEGRYAGQVEWKNGIDLCAERGEGHPYPVLMASDLMGISGNGSSGQTAVLFGEEHSVLGIHGEYNNEILFAPDDPCVSDLTFSVLSFVTRRPLSGSELDGLERLAGSLFRDPVLHVPSTPEMEYREALLAEMLLIAAFTAVAMIAFAFLFGFLLESRADEVRVMLLCGASRLRACLFVLSDSFAVNLILGTVSLIVFALVKDVIFSPFVNTTLRISDYLIVSICFLTVSLLVCCPMLYNHATNTLAEMRRKYIK